MTYGISRRLLLVTGVLSAAVAALTGVGMADSPPSGQGFPQTRLSERGLYAVTVRPEVIPVPVGTLHRWEVLVTDTSGAPAEGMIITVNGSMPGHGHGLPTHPLQTGASQGGLYRLDGLKFNMPGRWMVRLSLDGVDGIDSVIIPFDL